ncbi:MAG TPA: hypothetical protein PK482_05930 [Spirochaetota bacterium]|nr:hypothetical protein [Spirochaetota bacterium]
MKRFFTVCMSFLFAGAAFAQEAAKGPDFKYNVFASAIAVKETTAKKDEYKDYSAVRVRPTFTMGMENVSVVTGFEIDQFYGTGGNTTVGGNGSGSNSGYADPDGDQIAVEVKWAYIDVKDFFIPGLSMRAGLAPFIYSIGYNNDMPQFNLVYDAGVVKVDLAYVKIDEYDLAEKNATAEDKDDAFMYSFKLPVKLGDITITPAVLYAKGEKNHDVTALTGTNVDKDLNSIGNTGEFTKTMPSIGLALKAGDFSLNADFVYIMGKNKTFDAKYKAYAGYLNAGFKASDMLSLNLFGMYTTGQDDSDDKVTSFQAACGDELEVGPLFIINDAGNIGQVGVSNEYDKATEGLMAFGLGVNLKVDKVSVLAQVAYGSTTSDKIVKDKAIGTEIDLRLGYDVAPKTTFWVEGAYLMAGKYIETKNGGECDDPSYYAAGVTTKL